jgi:hypothetical protein
MSNVTSPTESVVGNGYGALRSVIEVARADVGCSLIDLTVLSKQVDPYRLDTPANHRDGMWLAEQLDRAIGRTRRIHWRGVHYLLVSSALALVKPDGAVYRNTEADWIWLTESAGKAARWLGYIPFERISDNRNAAPIIHRHALVRPGSRVVAGLDLTLPTDITPEPVAEGFEGRQAYHFAIFGEKASLEDVVDPIAASHHADLYLPTGEISDTLIYQIAADADADGRPLVMFAVADCDPAGRQMAVSIARKLQAFRDLLFPDFRFEVVPIALEPEQVRSLDLPSTPLKESEKRADRWREAFGIEQTEIDALATLRPDDLGEIVERAFDHYFDRDLDRRVVQARRKWQRQAERSLLTQIDPHEIDALQAEAARLQDALDDIDARLRALGPFTLPAIAVPQPKVNLAEARQALVGFGDTWLTATRALIARKAYGAQQ